MTTAIEPSADEIERVADELEALADVIVTASGKAAKVEASAAMTRASKLLRAAILAMDRRAEVVGEPVGYVDRLSNPGRISPTEEPGLEMPVFASPPAPAVAVPEQTLQMREALKLVRGIISDAAMTGFQWQEGDWAERLYASQAVTLGALAAAPEPPAAEAPADWQDDPSSDERWNAGLDYHAQQLCAVLGVDPKTVSWDAATEELEGDVRSVIGNILTAAMGESWMDRPAAEAPGQEPVAWMYRWKIDGVFVTWRFSDASQRNEHLQLKDYQEVPLFSAPPTYADAAAKLRENLDRVTDHLSTWAADHPDEATTETHAALYCARDILARTAAIRSLASPAPKEPGQ